jgi:hypothetical protein
MLDALIAGLLLVLQWNAFSLMLVGMAVGFVVGLLPGIGGAATLALMLPFVFKMTPELVSGYPANADILLAVERKEVDVWAAFATTIKLAADRGAVRPLVRGRVAVPGFEHLPVDEELATSALGKAIMGIRAAPLAIGRAFAAPPATPADRVQTLREALARAVKDSELLEEAKKAKIDIGYIAPKDVLKMFHALLEQPPEVQKEMVKYIKFGN